MASSHDTLAPRPAVAGGKKRLILAAAAVILLLGGSGTAAYFSGLLDFASSHAAAHAAPATEEGEPHGEAGSPQPAIVFVDLPDILVNLQTSGPRMRFLKLRVSLEVANEEAAQAVRGLMPRLLDSFQLYLRALSVEEVSGPGGMQRLKEDLVARSNLALDPAQVHDVLLKEILVQ